MSHVTLREREALHRYMASQDEGDYPTPEGFVGILVSALIMAGIFAFVMWLEPFAAWVERVIGR